MRTITATLQGDLVGRIWMPAVECSQPITARIERDRFSTRGSLRDCIESIMCHKGGDFQSCTLSADSVILVKLTRWQGNTRIVKERAIPVLSLPSIADYASEDAYAFAMED